MEVGRIIQPGGSPRSPRRAHKRSAMRQRRPPRPRTSCTASCSGLTTATSIRLLRSSRLVVKKYVPPVMRFGDSSARGQSALSRAPPEAVVVAWIGAWRFAYAPYAGCIAMRA